MSDGGYKVGQIELIEKIKAGNRSIYDALIKDDNNDTDSVRQYYTEIQDMLNVMFKRLTAKVKAITQEEYHDKFCGKGCACATLYPATNDKMISEPDHNYK